MHMYAYIAIYNIKSTKIQALGTLKIPFDIVFYALFNHGYHSVQELQNVRFYKYGITRVKNRSPDIILCIRLEI